MAEPIKTDSELVEGCLAGDTNAWDALIARYQGFLFGLALRLGLSQADAEDVFQNACLKLYQHLGELRQTERLSSWLAAIVRQEAWRLWRRHSSTHCELTEEAWLLERVEQRGGEPGLSPEEIFLAHERQHLVRQSLTQLSEECRQLLALLYGPEAPGSYAETARRLAIPVGSIGPKRARCLERLKKILESLGY